MSTRYSAITRRRFLAASGAGMLAAGVSYPAAAVLAPVRQGYQTNVWGMPTYYLLRSGHLEKHGIKFEEYAVPSGNLTMQQMVARQVDMGTYAGPSFIVGHARGNLAAIAEIERVGKSIRVMGRKDLNVSKIEQLKGRKVAVQSGASITSIFTETIVPAHGLKKGDYEEVRMNVTDMVAALAAKTVDAMVNVEPYNAIAEADGIAATIMDYRNVDDLPVFMAATPEFLEQNPDTVVAYLKAWLDVGRDFKENAGRVADTIYTFYTTKGYKLSRETFSKVIATVDVNPRFPADLKTYMQKQAEILLNAKQIKAIPDWDKALRPDFLRKAGG